jgi:hypothetical protein
MFYKPKYCCNCGEKIERANPSFTDSRRFCDVCQHDFVVQRAAPKIFVALMAIFGVFGLGSYWRSGEKPTNVSTRQIKPGAADTSKSPVNNGSQSSSNSNAPPAAQPVYAPTNASPALNLTTKTPAKKNDSAPVVTAETVYFCGAQTKKGTPCSRRVRGGGRCWQHKGQEAMLPPEKLLASR